MKNLLGLTFNGIKITPNIQNWSGDFVCAKYKLTSLEGSPHEIHGSFDCSNNKLTSLERAPSSVDGSFDCRKNNLTSLKDVHEILKKMDGIFLAQGNQIKSNVLGLLLIKGCRGVLISRSSAAAPTIKSDCDNAQTILNKYLPNTRGYAAVVECQSELLDANLDDFAEL